MTPDTLRALVERLRACPEHEEMYADDNTLCGLTKTLEWEAATVIERFARMLEAGPVRVNHSNRGMSIVDFAGNPLPIYTPLYRLPE